MESTPRSVDAHLAMRLQRMTESFSAFGLRAGGAIRLDPFLNLDDFLMSEATFPPHPHAGFSAVTYMFEDSKGAFVNRDSLGDRSRIEPGALHWTQAASGMMHEEVPEVPGRECHGLQMFVNLSAENKRAAPRAFHLPAAEVPEVRPAPGVRVRVLAGSFGGVTSPLTELLTPVFFADVFLEPDAVAVIPAPRAMTAFALAIRGAAASPSVLTAHSAVGFASDGDVIVLRGGPDGLQALVGAGAPIGEPVVFGGPFAMTNAADLREAELRFRRGEMGHLEPSR